MLIGISWKKSVLLLSYNRDDGVECIIGLHTGDNLSNVNIDSHRIRLFFILRRLVVALGP
jgi:hypothetical protein